MNELSILVSISVIIFTSPFFSKILRIPIAPIEIVLGAAAGYFGFLGHNHLFEVVAEVGFFYLMFLAGAEVDLKEFLKIDKATIKKGIVYVLMLYVLAFIVMSYFELNTIYIVILPLISVGMILTLFKEYGKDKPWLNLSMTIGTLGEVVSISLLTFISAMFEFGVGYELYRSLGYLFLFLVAIVLLFRFLGVLFWWYPELKVYLMPHYDKDEKDIRLSMALFFLMIALMLFLHLEIAFGAFVAGTFIATFFEHKKELPHKLSSFGFGFLVPTFFIYVGSTFNVEALKMDGVLLNAFLIVLASLSIRIISSFIFFKNLGLKQTILYGFSHSMPLTLVIAVATIAYRSQSIEQSLYFSFIVVSLFQVIVSMVSIKIISSLKFGKIDKKRTLV